MKITREFIEQHRTKRSGYTYSQIEALGETWPPKKGWIDRSIERELTPEAVALFVRMASREDSLASRRERRKQHKKAEKSAYKATQVAALERKLQAAKNPAKVKKAPKLAVPAYGGDVNADSFLASFQWRKLRMEVLRHYGPRCMCCGATPADGVMMNIDHIKPRRSHPHLALAFDNLQVLCNPCNHGKGAWDSTDWRPKAEEQIDPEVTSFIRSIARER
jgi:5-methylcytosine-specific restriction endonuclease McrA